MTESVAQQSYFIFNGIDTRKYGFYVTGESVYAAPAYAYNTQNVDGRDGQIIYSLGRHDNVDITYTIQVKGSGAFGFTEKFEKFRGLLATSEGYCQLTDGYNPDFLRYGYFKATSYASAMGQMWNGGSIQVTFSCKPQMYYISGLQLMDIPLLVTGKCSATGLEKSDGADARKRAGWFSMTDHTAFVVRAVNPKSAVSAKITQIKTYNASTWPICYQTNITLQATGEWITVSKQSGYDYLYIDFNSYELDSGYIECCYDSRENEPIRYSANGILILNETNCISKPIFNMIRMDTTSTTQFLTEFTNADYPDDDNRIWLLEHSASTNTSFYFDCEKQTVVGDDGTSMAKYVKMTDDQEGSIWAQSYPVLYPGENVYSVWGDWDTSQVTPYLFQIQTNLWTV